MGWGGVAYRQPVYRRIAQVGGWGVRDFTALPAGVSAREELANSVTGGIGLLASMFALAVLMDVPTNDITVQLGAVIYGLTLVASYGATTIYHSAKCHVRKAKWRLLDHCAVFALIAGSYTPLAIAVGGRAGWLSLSAVWLLAAFGIFFKVRYRFRFPGTSVAIYLVMGWMAVFMIGEIVRTTGPGAITLMAAGGISYTLGTILFGAKRLPYNHALWHVMVITGSALHYIAIVDHVLVAAA